jgi:hypothetical protein
MGRELTLTMVLCPICCVVRLVMQWPRHLCQSEASASFSQRPRRDRLAIHSLTHSFVCSPLPVGEDEYRQKVAIKIFDKLLLSRSSHQLLQVEKELNSLRWSDCSRNALR